jgi:hypothetical protein
MNWPIEFILGAAGCLGTIGLTRLLLSVYTTAWYNRRYAEVDNLVPFDHEKFHEIQNRPKPLGVKLNDWMEVHHV